MNAFARRRLAGPLLALAATAGCIPYSTGTTAAPVPQGELSSSAHLYFVPGGAENLTGDSVGGSLLGIDMEVRYGIDENSDIGVRVPGFSGVVLTYKRRLAGGPDPDGAALSALLGTGVVNVGEHAHFEASLLASARQSDRLTPYGGVKAMHVLRLTREAVRDDPTLGAFAGVRIGSLDLGLSPEVAVFHDRSALELRDTEWIIVPSFTFHGNRLFDMLFGRGSPRGPRRPPPVFPQPWPGGSGAPSREPGSPVRVDPAPAAETRGTPPPGTGAAPP